MRIRTAPLIFAVAVVLGLAADGPGFADPLTLSDAVAGAMKGNPAVVAAAAQRDQARARTAQADAQLKWQLTFSSSLSGATAGANNQPPPASETYGTWQNTISAPIPTGSKPRLAVLQARAQQAAADAQYEGAKSTVAAQVLAAYYDVLQKQAAFDASAESVEQAQRQRDDAEKRYKAGDVPELDVLRAQIPVDDAQAAQQQAQTALALSRQTLNDMIGRPLDDASPLADPGLPQILPITAEQARAAAEAASPDIKAAEANVAAQKAALDAARKSREPDLSLQVSDTRSSDLTSFGHVDSVQATINIPLSDGGLASAKVAEAAAALAQAKGQLDAAHRAVRLAASSAYVTAAANYASLPKAKATLDIAQTTYDKTLSGYRNGLFPLTDVLNAQAALVAARSSYAQSVFTMALSQWQLNILGSAYSLPGRGNPTD